MADVIVAAAEPSSAQPEAPSFADFENAANAEDLTGHAPESPKPETSATPDPSKATKPAPVETSKPQAEAAPEPGTGKDTQEHERRKPGAEARIGELTAKLRTAEEALSAERAKVAKPEAKAEPAKETSEVKPLDYKAFKADWIEKNPDATYDELSAAWADAVSKNTLELHKAEQTKATKEQAEKERVANFEKSWRERVEKARAKHADFDEVTKQELPLVAGGIVDAFIGETDIGPELLYELAKDVPGLEKLQSTHPIEAGIELSKRVLSLRGWKLTPPEEAKAAAAKAAPAKPTITRLAKPAPEVGGRGTAPEDPVIAAAKDDDFAAFEAAANAQDLAK